MNIQRRSYWMIFEAIGICYLVWLAGAIMALHQGPALALFLGGLALAPLAMTVASTAKARQKGIPPTGRQWMMTFLAYLGMIGAVLVSLVLLMIARIIEVSGTP